MKSIVDSVETIYSITSRIYETFGWGEALVESAEAPDTLNRRTYYTYYTNAGTDGNSYSHPKSTVGPDGNWVLYKDYDAEGMALKVVRQYASNAYDGTGTGETANWLEHTIVSSVDEDGDSVPDTTRRTDKYLKGELIGRTWDTQFSAPISLSHGQVGYYGNTTKQVLEVANSPASNRGDAGNSLTATWRDHTTGQVVRTLRPDGTTYLQYSKLGEDDYGVYGTVTRRAEGYLGSYSIEIGWFETSTQTLHGNESVSRFDAQSWTTLFSQSLSNFDTQGRARRIDYHDGSYEELVYGCCGLDEKRNRDGSVSTYGRDEMKRVTEEIVTVDGEFVRAIVTKLDPLNRVVATGRRASSTGPVQTTQETEYDLAGRVTSQRDALERETSYVYGVDSSSRPLTTITFPGGGMQVETYEKSGNLLQIGGTAALPVKYIEDVDSNGRYQSTISLSASNGEDEWERTDYDFQGRPWKVSHPYPSGTASYTYFSAGAQIIRAVDADGVTHLTQYDSAGRLEYDVIDLNGNNTIDLNGSDRVTRYAYSSEYVGSVGVNVTTTYVFTTNSSTTEREVSKRYALNENGRLVKLVTPQGITTYNYEYQAHNVKITETTPDGKNSETIQEAGRSISKITKANNIVIGSVEYTYDDYNRPQTATDLAYGTTTYSYYDDDQLHTITSADPDTGNSGAGYDPQVTTLEYDAAGRLWKTTLPDGRIETRTYYPTGKLQLLHGGDNYPQAFTYDAQGRTKTLRTWKAFNPTTGTGTGEAVTTWNYHPQRGWLTEKIYNPVEWPQPITSTVVYDYTAAGRVQTRTWERGVITTYGYTDAGDLETIDYSDSTPDVSLSYDREGRLGSVTDATGTVTRTYNPLNQPKDETYSGSGLLTGQAITRTFDGYQRPSTVGFGGGAYTATWGYGADTRLDTITQGNYTAQYGYRANSVNKNSVTYKQGATVKGSYAVEQDAIRRIAEVETFAGTTLVASRGYTYNDSNQRTETVHEDARKWVYGYDGKGQVTSADKKLSNGDPAPGYAFGFAFDDIGNRKSATRNGRLETYKANEQNGYWWRTFEDYGVDVWGKADADVAVLVNDSLATRTGEEFHGVAYFSTNSAENVELKIQAAKNSTTPGQVATERRGIRVPGKNNSRNDDEDGNLRTNGVWNFTWDAENRLKSAETVSDLTPVYSLPTRQRLEFAYDAFSRRVSKVVKNWNDTTSSWDTVSSVRYLYDGWNKIAELDALNGNAVLRSYVWGPDISGFDQGAGGVGGLLWANTSNGAHAPGYDGNGNIILWLALADATVSGTIEYGPFGEHLTSTGIARLMSFGFSTKYLDWETGLYDYGYRSYDPDTGRWLSRDSLDELDAPNLSLFVRNAPINCFDVLGYYTDSVTETYKKNPQLVKDLFKDVGLKPKPPPLPKQPPFPWFPPIPDNLPGEDLDAPGDCSQKQYDILAQAVQNAKKGLSGCKNTDCCTDLKAKHAAWLRLALAREKLNRTCFKGGDRGHRQAANDAWGNLAVCAELMAKICGPGEQ